MLYALKDEAYSLTVLFLDDGDYIVPDVGSVTYTVRGNDGSVLSGLADIAVTTDTSSTFATVTIASDKVTVADGLSFEQRFVTFEWTKDGVPASKLEVFRIVPWIGYTVVPQDVRGLLGVTRAELPDEAIDLVTAYFELKSELGETDTTTALTAGDDTTLAVNDALACWAALSVIPSLPLRVAQAEGDNSQRFTRFMDQDFPMLEGKIAHRFTKLVQTVKGASAVTPVFATLSSPTDPITGS